MRRVPQRSIDGHADLAALGFRSRKPNRFHADESILKVGLPSRERITFVAPKLAEAKGKKSRTLCSLPSVALSLRARLLPGSRISSGLPSFASLRWLTFRSNQLAAW